MHPDKQKNIYNLSPQDRYGYLIKRVANFEELWFIQDNGQYVTLGDNDQQVCIPVWPEREFAELMIKDDWSACAVLSMTVHDFIEWLDILEKEAVAIAGFPGADLSGVVVNAGEIRNHLIYELQQYE
jgi:hypothetical protein